MDLEKLRELHCKNIMPQRYEEEFNHFKRRLIMNRGEPLHLNTYLFPKNDKWLEKAEREVYAHLLEENIWGKRNPFDLMTRAFFSKTTTKRIRSVFDLFIAIWKKRYTRPATKEDYIRFLQKLDSNKHIQHYDKNFPDFKFRVLKREPVTPPPPVIDGDGFYLIVPERFDPKLIKNLPNIGENFEGIRLATLIQEISYHIFFIKDGSYIGNWVPIYNGIVNC